MRSIQRFALSWRTLTSSQQDLDAAVGELKSAAGAAGPASVAILSVPGRWAAEAATLSTKLKETGLCPDSTALLAVVQESQNAAAPVSLLLGTGGSAAPFFVNKEELSQAGAGLAKENPVPGVPDGPHASIWLFADSKVPGILTRNLLEALDARYPRASKVGVLVKPVASAEAEDPAASLQNWEPPREGRQLRTRDRSDGHGWMKSDPIFSTLEGLGMESTTVEFKKRPFGVKRYTPGYQGKGAMVIDMQEKGRYPGDAMGQAAVGGVRTGMVVKTVGGKDVSQWDFEDLMDLLNDQGIMDPDSKSAASWGDASKGQQRQPVEEVVLPVNIEFGVPTSGGGSSEAPLCLNSLPRQEGVVGLAFSEPLDAALRLSVVKMGPSLEVAKSGPNPEGGFLVELIRVQGKEMPAASALKGAAKAAGLGSMKGVCLGLRRPSSGADDAAAWAVFPLAGVSKTGGIVFRSKGPTAEGLGADDNIREVQFFAPGPGAAAALQDLTGKFAGKTLPLALVTSEEAAMAAPQSMPLVGPALIGDAGAGTTIHRQAVAVVAS